MRRRLVRALVVGGTGPTGPHIVGGLLNRGYEVSIFHRGIHEVYLPREVEHIHGDPHFPETIEQPLKGRRFDLAVVTYGRLRHLAGALKGRTERFISVGGGGAYRASWIANTETSPVPMGEDSPLQADPQFHKFSYQIVVSENAVMDAHQEGHYVATHFRYPWIYGPHALAPTEWSVVRRVLDGRKQLIVPCGGLGLHSRGYAENAGQAVLLAVDQPEASAGKIYNVSDDRVLSLREWIEIILGAMNCSMDLVDMPYAWSRPGYAYMRRLPHRVLDTHKIKSDLGYKDVVTAEEGLCRTITWLMENRPERGGDTEKAIGDPFHYQAEDRIIAEYMKVQPQILSVPVREFEYRHPYAHPKRPSGLP